MVRAGEQQQFCCNGCRQVHAILHDLGYENFYRIRESQKAEGRRANPSGRTFEDFDDESFLSQYAERTDRGTCRTRFYLEGVHCAACVWLVEELPRSVDGLVGTRLNFANAVVSVEWDPDTTQLSQIGQAFDSIGYVPHAHRSDDTEKARKREERSLLLRLGVAAACAMNIMFLHGALYAGEYSGMDPRFEAFFRWISFALAIPVVLYSARPFYRAAWAGVRNRVPHMDLPIALALTAAFAYSAVSVLRGAGPVYFDSLAALVALLLGARFVQGRAQRAAIERANSLRDVAFAEFARRLEPLEQDGALAAEPTEPSELSREVPLGALRKGDQVEVRSGELIPVDGRVIRGSSSIDNAALTGESTPITVTAGATVHAGAVNLGSRLIVGVEAAGADTRVGALLALVEDAMARRPPIVQTADRLSRHFVMVVLALAAVTAAYWLSVSMGAALEQTIALLVVTCPCALGLATPVAMSVGLARAARAGIFVKTPDAIEQLEHADTILLDKTGTLTEGAPTVSRWQGDREAVELARALEFDSTHPVAQAMRRAAERPVRVARVVTDVCELSGLGITGAVDGRAVAVGNRALMDRQQAAAPPELERHADALVTDGQSPLYVAVDGAIVAVGGVGDPLRGDARTTVEALRRRGMEPRILSGDHPAIVARVAAELGISDAHALGGLSPEQKRDVVAELTAERTSSAGNRRVVMVGDGVNDAAAMALADVGIAVQGGAGASIVAADVVLTRPGLEPLAEVVTGSRRLLWVVYRNLLFSLAYNAVGATLAIAGLVGPLAAALLMPASSLTVILSSALARPFRAVAAQPRRNAA
jgi:Cu2+-exporting ATPase